MMRVRTAFVLCVCLTNCAGCAGQALRERAQLAKLREEGPCQDFEQDVERVWNAEVKAHVSAAFVKLGVEYADRVVERVTTGMDDITSNWVMLNERLCKDYLVRKAISKPDYLARTACFDAALIRQRTFARMLATPGQSYAAKAIEAFEDISNKLDACQNRATWLAYTEDALSAPSSQQAESVRQTEELASEAVLAATFEDTTRAQHAAQQALALAERTGNKRVLTEGLLASALVDLDAARLDIVADKLKRAIELASTLGSDLLLAQAYQHLGQLQHELHQYPGAIAAYQQALKLRRPALPADHPLIAWTLDNLGAALHAHGDDPAALQMHEQALAIYRAQPALHTRASADALTNLGLARASMGDHRRALTHYQLALSIDPPVSRDDRAALADTLNDLGLSHRELDQIPQALDAFQRALTIYRASMNEQHPHIARALYNLGATYLRAGSVEQAAATLTQSIAVLEPSADVLAVAHNDLGVALGQLGQYDHAAREFQLALTERLKPAAASDADIADTQVNLGIALSRAGHSSAALPQLQQALERYQRDPNSHPDRISACLGHIGVAQGAARQPRTH